MTHYLPMATFRIDRRGSAAAEFALVLPIFCLIVFGLIQLGILYNANAGLAHGLGEGARYATLYPRHTPIEIQDRIRAAVFGINGTFLAPPVITYGISQGVEYADISVTYYAPVAGGAIGLPPIILTKARRAYLP